MKQLIKLRSEFLINKVVRLITFGRGDRVLQIGPGDGLLFELIHKNAGECHGVEPDAAIWIQLSDKLRGRPNVLIQHARATNLPFPRSYFSRVIFHDAAAHVRNELEMRRIVEEIRRVSKSDAVVFVGGVPMAPEQAPRGTWQRLVDRFGWIRRAMREHRWIRSVVGGGRTSAEFPEPVFSEGRFLSICRQYGLDGTPLRTELIHSLSKTRNDFLLHPTAGPERHAQETESELSEQRILQGEQM